MKRRNEPLVVPGLALDLEQFWHYSLSAKLKGEGGSNPDKNLDGFFLHESAILDYDEVIRREPENATAYFHRALSKFRLNHLDPAKEDLLTAQPLAVSAGDEGLMEQIEHILFEINFRLKRLSE